MITLKVLPLFVVFLAVYFLKRGGVLKNEYNSAVSKLVVFIVAPAVITKSLAQAIVTPSLLYLPVIAVLGVLSLLAIGYALSYLLNLKGKTRGSFIIAFPTLEECQSNGYGFGRFFRIWRRRKEHNRKGWHKICHPFLFLFRALLLL